jgi:NAD(P)-dependent dehydrogenase (short-subunit alcohol dehydrogenase family)
MSTSAPSARFVGRVAIVTGGAGTIGRATARRLAAEGASVTVADRRADAAAAVVDEIAATGGVARVQAVDVTEPGDVARMVVDTVTAYGRLDVLHNNAAAIALNGRDQDVVTMDLDTWHTVLDVNLTGPMLGCRAAIPVMLERGGGAIVNTASAAAFYGSPTLAAYGTSKAALVALTRSVAAAYAGRGIRCNAVATVRRGSPTDVRRRGGRTSARRVGDRAGRADEHRDEDAERQHTPVADVHVDVAQEQHQQPRRRERGDEEHECEHDDEPEHEPLLPGDREPSRRLAGWGGSPRGHASTARQPDVVLNLRQKRSPCARKWRRFGAAPGLRPWRSGAGRASVLPATHRRR